MVFEWRCFCIAFSANNSPLNAGTHNSSGPLTSAFTAVTSLAQSKILYCDSSLSWPELTFIILWSKNSCFLFCSDTDKLCVYSGNPTQDHCTYMLFVIIMFYNLHVYYLQMDQSVCIDNSRSCVLLSLKHFDSIDVGRLSGHKPMSPACRPPLFYYLQVSSQQTAITSSNCVMTEASEAPHTAQLPGFCCGSVFDVDVSSHNHHVTYGLTWLS